MENSVHLDFNKKLSSRIGLIYIDFEKVFNCGIDEWEIMAGACQGMLNAWGLKKTPGWVDGDLTVIDYPNMDEECELYLGEWINFGTKNPLWKERVMEYLEYLIKINK